MLHIGIIETYEAGVETKNVKKAVLVSEKNSPLQLKSYF